MRGPRDFFAGIAMFAAAIPIYQTVFGYPHGEGGYALFSNICHQYPTRSFWITDRPFALSSRCTGGYLGLALSPILFYVSRNQTIGKIVSSRRFLVGGFLLAAAIIDPLLEIGGLYETINFHRFVSGAIGGLGLYLLLFPIRLAAVSRAWRVG